ncbi:MAG: hypothetical protein IH948_02975 [Bacteroidetes bacterium]|nr:hypothetical protein [Bacteroidota bacterium]
MRKPIIIFLAICISCYVNAQENYIHLNRTFAITHNKALNQLDFNFHTGVKPLNPRWVNKAIESSKDDTVHKGWLYRKFKRDHLIHIEGDDYDITIDPLFNFSYGVDIADTSSRADQVNLINNTRAAIVTGRIGKAITFSSTFYENQTYFRAYIDDHIRSKEVKDGYGNLTGIVPGQGRVKEFKQFGFDYAMASGNVTFTPNSKLSFSLGNGKHFIGEGYRSLFLSDNAFNYPFFSGTINLGPVQYTTIYSLLQNYYRMPGFPTSDALFQRKKASFSYLSWNLSRKVQLGFFEGIIWKSQDISGSSAFNYNFLNPIIYTRSLQYSLDNKINALIGLSTKIKAFEGGEFYGQLMLDELKIRDKYGFQLGLKVYDPFKLENLYVQIEYNMASAFSYAHMDSSQSYSHTHDALAHPMGANFSEVVSIINYKIKSFRVGMKYNYANFIQDTAGTNTGNNIFISDVNDKEENGISTKVNYLDFNVSYLLNPKTNMSITLGLSNRLYRNALKNETSNFIYIAFRTCLTNIYYDF